MTVDSSSSLHNIRLMAERIYIAGAQRLVFTDQWAHPESFLSTSSKSIQILSKHLLKEDFDKSYCLDVRSGSYQLLLNSLTPLIQFFAFAN